MLSHPIARAESSTWLETAVGQHRASPSPPKACRGHMAPGHELVTEHTTVFHFVLPGQSSNTGSWTKVYGSDFY